MSDDRFKLRQRVQTFVGAAGVGQVDYLVPAGTSSKILQATVGHDDVAARNCRFTIIHGAVSMNLTGGGSIPAGSLVSLYTTACPMGDPFILRAGMTLRGYCDSLGAGKFVTMSVAMENQLGDDTYGD